MEWETQGRSRYPSRDDVALIANSCCAHQGWQYLFLIEGAITLGVAIFLYLCAPRSPDKSPWFTDQERRLAKARLEEDSQDQDKEFRWEDAKKQLKQWPTWAFAFLALMYGVGVASSSNFLPVSLENPILCGPVFTIGTFIVLTLRVSHKKLTV